MHSFIQACLDGLLTGALYALIGMGLALIFGVMRIVNFAHGAFLMLGMYASWVLYDKYELNPYLALIPGALALFVFGYLVYLAVIRPIRTRSDFMQILMTTGLSLILVDSVQLKFGADYHQTNIELVNRTLHLGAFTLNAASLLSFAIAAALIVGLQQFVMRSRTGQGLRAIAQNPDVAPLMGINVTRVQGFSFAVGIMMAGIAGSLLLPALYLFPTVGDDYTLKAFVIVVLGGMGSIEGAAIGGLVLGVTESITSLYLGNEWALAVDFVLFLLVLSLKPSGIFGRQRA